MPTVKINITDCKLVADKGDYKTYAIIDAEGTRYGSTQEFEIGEQEVELIVNGQYKNIKKLKVANKFPVKDYTFEKKKAALDASVSLIVSGKVEVKDLIATSDKILTWLKQ